MWVMGMKATSGPLHEQQITPEPSLGSFSKFFSIIKLEGSH